MHCMQMVLQTKETVNILNWSCIRTLQRNGNITIKMCRQEKSGNKINQSSMRNLKTSFIVIQKMKRLI